MPKNSSEKTRIINLLIERIGEAPADFSAKAFSAEQGVSLKTVYRYLQELEENGLITITASGRKNDYRLVEISYEVTMGIGEFSEDLVWKRHVEPFFADLPAIAKANLGIAFTEMLNNAIDHSQGTKATIHLIKNGFEANAIIMDDGIGIFRKITDAMKLEDKSFAILELAKGKFTTEPDTHSGQGVFFSSKMVDDFAIISEGLIFLGPTSAADPYLDSIESSGKGTTVFMGIKYSHSQTAQAVYDDFAGSLNDYSFSKTIVPVRLLEYGNERPLVVSRSQAKRLIVRFERFRNIILDFEGIDSIGQGFADELFRVFAGQHPASKLIPVNCNQAVQAMINRVQAL